MGVVRAARSLPMIALRAAELAAVDAIQHLRDLRQSFGRRVEALAGGEAHCPVRRGPSAPVVRRQAQHFARGAPIALRGEIVERPVEIAETRPALRAVEGGGDD